jgi:ribosome recycling factor
MVKDALNDAAKKMKASTEHFRKDIGMLRTGRANISIFEEIRSITTASPRPSTRWPPSRSRSRP